MTPIVSEHSHVWAQSCGDNHVWAQSCMGPNVSDHNRVRGQTFLGTNESVHKHVGAQSCAFPTKRLLFWMNK